MEREELINKIKTRIDEVSTSGDIIVDVDIENTKPYDSIIDELLDESALEVLLKAPFYRLSISKAELVAVEDDTDKKIGTIILPDDFIRLVSLRMAEWQRPVTEFAVTGDITSQKQYNKHLRGGLAKPVAVLSKTEEGYKAAYYSVRDSHEVAEFLYIKQVAAEEISDSQVMNAMCWICAGKTLGVLGQPNLANQCYDNAKGLLI